MNKYTGEVALDIGGKPHRLVFDWEALSRLQSELGENALASLGFGMEVTALAAFVAAGLQRHHPGVTAEEIIRSAPPLVLTIEAVQKAMEFALWGPDGPPKEESEPHPRKRKAIS